MRVPSSAKIRADSTKEGPNVGPKKVTEAARVRNDSNSGDPAMGLKQSDGPVVLNPRTLRLVANDPQDNQERADRVQAVKAEFQAGNYKLDLDQLSDSLLEQDKEALGL